MSISIEIHYLSHSTKISQRGAFPLRGRKPEFVALQFWKQINEEMSYHALLEKVTCNEEDITQLVKELEMQEWNKTMNDNLPF